MCVLVFGSPYRSSDSGWVSARQVVELYQAKALEFIHDIDGVYTIIVVDKAARQCHVVVDRHGINALYYAAQPKQVVLYSGDIV